MYPTTNLLDQIITVDDEAGQPVFGRVRAVYIGKDGYLRLVVLLTSGRLVDIWANNAQTKKEGHHDKKEDPCPTS